MPRTSTIHPCALTTWPSPMVTDDMPKILFTAEGMIRAQIRGNGAAFANLRMIIPGFCKIRSLPSRSSHSVRAADFMTYLERPAKNAHREFPKPWPNALPACCIDPQGRHGLYKERKSFQHELCDRMSQFDYLREKLRRLRDQNPADLNLRSHRAVTWLCRSDEVFDSDPDASFIFAWISFNAAYARDIGNDPGGPARSIFQDFFTALVAADPNGRIAHELWYQHEGLIARLLDNRFIFNPFWRFHNGEEAFADWQDRFERAKEIAREATERENTPLVLSIIFDRLYVLRNQLIHGGATWGSRVNRNQVKDGAEILHCLMPIFVDTMVSATDRDWGTAHYPVVE